MADRGSPSQLTAHVPRVVVEWLVDAPEQTHRRLDGTLVFADVSGFTALSERLAGRGRIGAEELTDAINSCFESLLAVAYRYGGGLLKFGGDAILLLFDGPGHLHRGVAAAQGMRRELRTAGRIETTAGTTRLGMSIGVHRGELDLFLVGDTHRELIVAGPEVSRTVTMEHHASRGEVLASSPVATELRPASLGGERAGGRLVTNRLVPAAAEPAPRREGVDPTVLAAAVSVAIRRHLEAGTIEPEHRTATVAFVHFDGTDARISADPVAAAAELHHLVTRAQAVCAANGVAFLASDVDHDGGKLILVAGAPDTAGDDEDRMVRALRQLIDDPGPLPLRIGVHRGPVFAGEVGPPYRRAYTVMGDTVNLAARLMAAAAPGQLIASSAVLDRLKGVYAVTALPPFTVKGKRAPVEAGLVGDFTNTVATAETDRTPIVGRDPERAELARALEGARAGRGGLVNITGEPGLGKSRLALSVVEGAAVRGVGRGDPYDAAVPWGALRRALVPVVPGALDVAVAERAPHLQPWLPLLAAVFGATTTVPTPEVDDLDPAFRLDRTHRALVDLIDAVVGEGDLVIVLDDIHWADSLTVGAVRALGDAAVDRRWLLVTTTPPGATDLVASAGTSHVELGPLDDEATAALADAAALPQLLRPDERDRIVSHAGGNPLFIRELVASRHTPENGDDVPDSLESVIGRQIDRLDPGDRKLLRTASVLGASFDPQLLAAIVGDEMQSGIGRAMSRLGAFLELELATARIRFRNPCVRDVAYATLPFRRRRELHLRAGTELEARGTALADAAVLALHAHHGGDHERSWRYSVAAGWQAARRYAHPEAAGHFDRALAAAGHLGTVAPERVGRVWTSLASAAFHMGDYERAAKARRAARRLHREPVVLARLHGSEASIRDYQGDGRGAQLSISAGLKVLGAREDVPALAERAELRALRAFLYQAAGRPRDALTWCERALADAAIAGNESAEATASMVSDWAHLDLGRPDLAVRSDHALEIWRKRKKRRNEAALLNNMGAFAYYQGRWGDAVELYGEARAVLRRIGSVADAEFGACNIAEILIDQGRLDEAEELLDEAARTWRSVGYAAAVAFAERHLAKIAVRRGHLDDGERLLHQVREVFATYQMAAKVVEVDVWLGECALRRGAIAEGVAILDGAIAAEASGGASALLPALLRLRGYGHAGLGHLVDAWADLDESLHLARARTATYDVALTLEAIALVAAAGGGTPPPDAATERTALLNDLGVRWTPPPPVAVG